MQTRLSAVLLSALGIAASLPAQQPTRLPGMVVSAPAEKPGPRLLAGIVRDTFSIAIDSVEVTIAALQRRSHTDSAGKFQFTDIRPGEYDVRVRRIGYAPQMQRVIVDSAGGIGTFDLLPLHRSLPPVIVSADRGGLSGVVGDTAYHAIRGATVRLLGENNFTITDSLGRFFLPVQAGQYVLAVRQDGFYDKTIGIRIPKDSGRRVSIFLTDRKEPVPNREAHNVDALESRVAWRNRNLSRIYDRDALTGMNVEWLSDAVQAGYSISGGKGPLQHGCKAILNGGLATVDIDALTIDDVESVEVYVNFTPSPLPSRTRTSPVVSIYSKKGVYSDPTSIVTGDPIGKKDVADSHAPANATVVFSNTTRAAIQNAGKACAIVYVWTR